MSKLSVEWFAGIKPEDKQKFEDTLRNSIVIVRQLNLLLDRWEDELKIAESKLADYETPAWAYKQAHRNGDRSRIRKLRDLLSFIKE